MSGNKVLNFVGKLQQGKVSSKEVESDIEAESQLMEVAYVKEEGGQFLLVTYHQAAAKLLSKTHKFMFVQQNRRFECKSNKLPKHKLIDLVEFLPPQTVSPAAMRKIRTMIEAIESREKAISLMQSRVEVSREKLKKEIRKHGVGMKMGLSQDKFVIYEKQKKAQAVMSTHIHINNEEVIKLAKKNKHLETAVRHEPVVDKNRVLEVFDKLSPNVQQQIMLLTTTDSGLQFFNLKGEVCQTCGSKLTKNAKTGEKSCKKCDN